MLAKPQGFPRKLGGCAGLDPRLRSAVSAGVGDGERGLRRGLRAPGVGVRPKWVLEYSPSNKRIRYFVSITYVRTGLWTAHKFCGGGKKLWFTSYFSDLSRANAAGGTAVWRAAQVGDVAAMRLLIGAGADPEITTEEGVSPLNVATGAGFHGNDEVTVPGGLMPAIRYLIEELGADVNQADNGRGGYTPLHNAAGLGDNEMVQYLVDHGANVRALSDSGQTVADMANGPRQRIQPFPETIALLRKLGSPFNDNCVSC